MYWIPNQIMNNHQDNNNGDKGNRVFSHIKDILNYRLVDMTPQRAGGEMTVLKFLDEVKSIESGIQRIK